MKTKKIFLYILALILVFFTWLYWEVIFTPEGYCDDPDHAYDLICEPMK